MTASENAPETPWEPEEAYPQLASLAAQMRPDWDRQDLWDALTAVRHAGWQWPAVFREMVRLVLAQDEAPATLRNSARRPVPAQTGPAVYAHGGALARAALEEVAARKTGPMAVLNDNDPRQENR
jgi:hypothetical protein